MTDPRGQLLRAALGVAGCLMPLYGRTVRAWLDSSGGTWRIALVITCLPVLVLPLPSAATEWVVCAMLYETCSRSPKSTFADESSCRTAAESRAKADNIETRCVVQEWRLIWLSAPKAYEGVTVQQHEPDARVFATEFECLAYLRSARAPRADRSIGQCVADLHGEWAMYPARQSDR